MSSVSVCSVLCSFSSLYSLVLSNESLSISRLCSFTLLSDKVLDEMDDAKVTRLYIIQGQLRCQSVETGRVIACTCWTGVELQMNRPTNY